MLTPGFTFQYMSIYIKEEDIFSDQVHMRIVSAPEDLGNYKIAERITAEILIELERSEIPAAP
jgi:hypothetical protein